MWPFRLLCEALWPLFFLCSVLWPTGQELEPPWEASHVPCLGFGATGVLTISLLSSQMPALVAVLVMTPQCTCEEGDIAHPRHCALWKALCNLDLTIESHVHYVISPPIPLSTRRDESTKQPSASRLSFKGNL